MIELRARPATTERYDFSDDDDDDDDDDERDYKRQRRTARDADDADEMRATSDTTRSVGKHTGAPEGPPQQRLKVPAEAPTKSLPKAVSGAVLGLHRCRCQGRGRLHPVLAQAPPQQQQQQQQMLMEQQLMQQLGHRACGPPSHGQMLSAGMGGGRGSMIGALDGWTRRASTGAPSDPHNCPSHHSTQEAEPGHWMEGPDERATRSRAARRQHDADGRSAAHGLVAMVQGSLWARWAQRQTA